MEDQQVEEGTYDPSQLPELLQQYYVWLFPFDKYYEWLSYGEVNKKVFTNREFSFTLEGDIYVRYQSFKDQKEMEQEIRKRTPHKIDIGAVFSAKPCDHKKIHSAAFKPESKELVFDIDLTDYDEVRTCCSAANICVKCWKFIVVAVKVVDRSLRVDFGFRHLFWVYSGRRGVHCWVCDEAARKLSQDARSAIAEYLSLVKGGEAQAKKVHLPDGPLHHSIVKALEVVDRYFPTLLMEQGFLETKEALEKVLLLLPKSVQQSLQTEFEESGKSSSDHRWSRILQAISRVRKQRLAEEIKLQYCYPRLDVNVTKGLNHLLKSPFCIHPKTGRVCIPINVEEVDAFNPELVPTVSQLCAELNSSQAPEGDGAAVTPARRSARKAYMQTSLGSYIRHFDSFFLKPLKQDILQARRAEGEVSMDF